MNYEIDIAYLPDETALTVIFPKSVHQNDATEFIDQVVRAFAETEKVDVERMREILAVIVRKTSNGDSVRYVWRRQHKSDDLYPNRLSDNLKKQKPKRTVN